MHWRSLTHSLYLFLSLSISAIVHVCMSVFSRRCRQFHAAHFRYIDSAICENNYFVSANVYLYILNSYLNNVYSSLYVWRITIELNDIKVSFTSIFMCGQFNNAHFHTAGYVKDGRKCVNCINS